jgi:predicted ArsR family transcriptional regulator
MMTYQKSKGHTEGTRDRLIRLLQEGPKSVEELAGGLGITLNAVRSQLTILERDGLVHMAGERKGARRPSLLFGLTAEGEQLLSRAYVPMLKAVLQAMSLQSAEGQVEEILRETGRRLAVEIGRPAGDFHARVLKALALLEDLGAHIEVEESEGKLILRGRSCPLSEAVAVEPRTCKCLETLLSELTGAKVEESCERGSKKRCQFIISPPVDMPLNSF